jgi:hypothetical protein
MMIVNVSVCFFIMNKIPNFLLFSEFKDFDDFEKHNKTRQLRMTKLKEPELP